MQESEGVLCMRVSFRIALAGQVIGVSALYEQTRTFCKNYLTDASIGGWGCGTDKPGCSSYCSELSTD